jgi:hypothetical protein
MSRRVRAAGLAPSLVVIASCVATAAAAPPRQAWDGQPAPERQMKPVSLRRLTRDRAVPRPTHRPVWEAEVLRRTR